MTEKRYFISDVEENFQRYSVWRYDDKFDDYIFVCFVKEADISKLEKEVGE